jgi:hypothetical protein
MTGNPRKGGVWNRPGSVGRHPGRGGSASADYKDALTVEEAVEAAHWIKVRAKREDGEARTMTKIAAARAKVTLPSLEWITKFMKDD